MYESSTKETKWVCIQLACSQRPRALEEAHCWNIQAKFYNEKFPLVYESDNIGESLYEKHGATLKHKCGKRIVALSLFWAFLFLFGLSLFLGQCSNIDGHHTSIYLQLKNYNSILRTRDESI